MDAGASAQSRISDQLELYTAWVRDLRNGKSVSPLPLDTVDPLARLGRELQLLAENLTQRETEIRKMLSLVREVERGILVEDVLNKIFDGFSGIIPFDRIGCAFLSHDGSRLTASWARTHLGPMQIAPGYSQPMAGSSLQDVFRTGRPRILNDLESYLAAKPTSDSTARIVAEGGRSNFTCPLMTGGRAIGFLFFTSKEKNAYREVHETIFLQIATEVATVIEKSRLYQRLIDNNRELLQQSQQLEKAATRDPLTGILNRGAVLAVLNEMLGNNAQIGNSLGLIMTDIDHFKLVNDTYGHPTGDKVLCEFTRRIAAALRQSDTIGRYGGEEFLILIASATRGRLMQLAERLRRVIADTPFDFGEVNLQVTASFGVAINAGLVASAESFVALADRALYAAKSNGRNRCEFA